MTKDLDFGALVVASRLPAYGVIILRLPFSFNSGQIRGVLENFLKTADLKKLPKSITVVELGRYRIRKI
ncbi:MAG: hypothetical protein KGH94_00390 [Candidatus Micrarchaeota archaeon]|nr:hypothetical protein [Candidatus Micrarchaeota archaeon]